MRARQFWGVRPVGCKNFFANVVLRSGVNAGGNGGSRDGQRSGGRVARFGDGGAEKAAEASMKLFDEIRQPIPLRVARDEPLERRNDDGTEGKHRRA
jgi:hypothetical protein